MTARPILFSAPMVRAILAGRKTQTRRIVKSPHVADADRWAYSERLNQWESGISGEGGVAAHGEYVRCPYGEPGDELWIKETWRTAKNLDAKSPKQIAAACLDAGYQRPWAPMQYEADGVRDDWSRWGVDGNGAEAGKVRVSIHMPRWASRITLRVTSVRVERLQAITAEEAIAEGATSRTVEGAYGERVGWSMDWSRVGEMSRWATGSTAKKKAPLTAYDVALGSPQMAYANAWDKINGKLASWASNPWVWVVGFEVML